MRRVLLSLAVLLGVLGSPGELAAQSGGSLSIGIVDPPDGPHDDPRAQYYVVDHVEPGGQLERRIRVGNTSDAALPVSLYVAAAEVTDGAFGFGERRATNELTEWATVRPSTVEVASGSTADAVLSIDVPDGAVTGERYGVVWAELPPTGGAAGVVNRIGVRIYLSVGEGAAPRSQMAIESFTPRRDDEGRAVVDVTVRNTGGRAYDLVGEVALEREGGGAATLDPVPVAVTLAPGDLVTTSAVFDVNVDRGPWRATLSAAANGVEERARATLTFPDGMGRRGTAVRAEPVDDGGRGPAAVVAVGLAALVVGALGLHLVARRR